MKQIIIDHNHPLYREKWAATERNKYNGAFFYSKEIVRYMVPAINTDRNWITVNVQGACCNHAICFIHNNLHPENYDWLKWYGMNDLILVCGVPETVAKVKHIGKAIYLPLSIDVADVKTYKRRKDRDIAYAGRKIKRMGIDLDPETEYIEGLPRTKFLKELARYKRVYAVGRVALEALVLGCEVLPFDPRYPDPNLWKVLDTRDAAKKLQKEIDKIDRRRR